MIHVIYTQMVQQMYVYVICKYNTHTFMRERERTQM